MIYLGILRIKTYTNQKVIIVLFSYFSDYVVLLSFSFFFFSFKNITRGASYIMQCCKVSLP